MPVVLNVADKFAILAVDRCQGAPTVDIALPDGTVSLARFPAELTETWQRWIGESRTNALLASNLTLFRKLPNSHAGNLDEEHEVLKQHVYDIFCLLQLSGSLHYQGASLLLGRSEPYGVVISQVIQLQDFHATKGETAAATTQQRLDEAVEARQVRQTILALPTYGRFKRGARIITEGLAEWSGSERLHQFVRALEALMIPAINKTRRQFVRRAKMFTSGQTGTGYILGQIYDMRSDVEHIHELSRTIRFLSAAEQETVALLRTRQIQALTCSAYRRIYASNPLLQHFETDEKIQQFWVQNEVTIRQDLGNPLDLLAIP
jgi:hypothetical protein